MNVILDGERELRRMYREAERLGDTARRAARKTRSPSDRKALAEFERKTTLVRHGIAAVLGTRTMVDADGVAA